MASAVRKIAQYLGLVDDEGYYEEQGSYAVDVQQDDRPNLYPVDENTVAPTVIAPPTADAYRIVSIQPTTFNDARRIGEEFRKGSPVILNLGEREYADQARIVDFAAGLAMGLHGALEKVAKEVFLLSPQNIDVSLAARAQLRDEPFFNQR